MNGLIDKARAGNQAAIYQLLESCRPGLLASVNARLPLHLRTQVAEDIVQNGISSALNMLSGFSFPEPNPSAAFCGWLRTYVEGAYHDWWKYVTALKRDYRRNLTLSGDNSTEGAFLGGAATDDDTPSRILRRRERLGALEEAIQHHLTHEEQVAVPLRYLERLPVPMVAAILDRSPGAVSNHSVRIAASAVESGTLRVVRRSWARFFSRITTTPAEESTSVTRIRRSSPLRAPVWAAVAISG
jgi:RNA polymerase sigma factor (sigma-70 family)